MKKADTLRHGDEKDEQDDSTKGGEHFDDNRATLLTSVTEEQEQFDKNVFVRVHVRQKETRRLPR